MAMNTALFADADRKLWKHFGLAPQERSLYLERIGTDVRAQIVGDDGPVILFIHGGSNAGTSWVDLVSKLPGYRCVVVDRPGCGLSPRFRAPLKDRAALARFGDDFVVDVLDALGVETADVIGTSFGGYFALRGVGAATPRVRHLVLFGYSIGAPLQHIPVFMRMSAIPGMGQMTARMKTPRAAIKPMLRQIGLKDALANGNFSDAHIDWFLGLLRDTDTMLNELRDLPVVITPLNGLNPEVLLTDADLARVTVPTLMLWGRSDPFGGETVARPFVARVPGATLEMVDGGHAAWIDDPEGIGARVKEFLAT